MQQKSRYRPILFAIALGVLIFGVSQYMTGVIGLPARNWERDLEAAKVSLSTRQDAYQRFTSLTAAELPAIECKDYGFARACANEALALAPRFRQDWNYGNAIHDSHVVLGRLALKQNDVAAARNELLLAGQTPGSPQLNSFGPNMSLAKDLLSRGQRDVVLQYFDQCQGFWRSDYGALAKWRFLVRIHLPPDFGTHLLH